MSLELLSQTRKLIMPKGYMSGSPATTERVTQGCCEQCNTLLIVSQCCADML